MRDPSGDPSESVSGHVRKAKRRLNFQNPTLTQIDFTWLPKRTRSGLASKIRTVKVDNLVSCFGVRSQRVNGSPTRYGRVGDCRKLRCNRRFQLEPGSECRNSGG